MNALAIATHSLVCGEILSEDSISQLTEAERQVLDRMRDLVEQDPHDLARTMAQEGPQEPWPSLGR